MCPGRKASWDLIINTCKQCDKLQECYEGQLFLKTETRIKWNEVTDYKIKEITGSNHINI